jgi:hypothetical protein
MPHVAFTCGMLIKFIMTTFRDVLLRYWSAVTPNDAPEKIDFDAMLSRLERAQPQTAADLAQEIDDESASRILANMVAHARTRREWMISISSEHFLQYL